ncbi:MAG: TPM domain-containing protein [Oscillospiraceae bacterium]|nr:TPM domain-containing protein [Oscillospiraceae bacterium]
MIKTRKASAFILALLTLMAALLVFDTRAYAAKATKSIAIGDFDNRLTDHQENELRTLMQAAAEETGLNIGIVITGDLNGRNDESFTNEFGFSAFGDSDWVVLMLFNSYDRPEYSRYTDVISRHRKADDRLRRYDKQMFDNIYAVLERNAYKDYSEEDIYHLFDYYGACRVFVSDVKKLGSDSFATRLWVLIQYHTGQILLGAVIAAVVTVIIVTSTVKGYKKVKPISATNYIDRSRTRITRQVDRFMREYTTSVSTSSSHSGGHGGGGHHSSSHGHHR